MKTNFTSIADEIYSKASQLEEQQQLKKTHKEIKEMNSNTSQSLLEKKMEEQPSRTIRLVTSQNVDNYQSERAF